MLFLEGSRKRRDCVVCFVGFQGPVELAELLILLILRLLLFVYLATCHAVARAEADSTKTTE